MPVDSEDKRRSIPRVISGLPGLAGTPPIPDGDLDSKADRMHIAGFYRGITPAAPPVAAKRRDGLLLRVY